MSQQRIKLNKRKRGIREAILIDFALLSIISLGTIALTSGIFVGVIGNLTSSQTTQTLETQVEFDMLNKTQNYAAIIQSQLEQTTRDINSLSKAVSNVFQNPFEYGDRKSYYHVDMLPAGVRYLNGTLITSDIYFPQNVPPDAKYDPILELDASYNYSHYLIYNNTYKLMGNNEYNLTGIHGEYINRSAQLDPLMRDLILNNDHYSWIYIEFEIGIQRTFPWTGVDTTIFGPEWHDYKQDDWYIDAKAAGGSIIWTAPYLDPYIGWIVTISRAVYNGSEFLGVLGIDFTLNAITQTVGNIQLFDTGYGFLMDQEGWIISHPNVIFDPGEEDPTNVEDVEPLSGTILGAMKAGQSGFAEFTKGNKNYYISYRTIPISNYVLGIIVPAEEVLAPVIDLQNQIMLNLTIQIILMFFIIGAIILLSVFIGVKVSDTIVKPIKRLTDLALDLSTEDIRKTSVEKSEMIEKLDELIEQDDEIGGLSRSFKNLFMMVRDQAISEDKQKNLDKTKED
jgi:hypothetical protein